MSIATPRRMDERPPAPRPDRRPLLVGICSFVVVALVVVLVVGARSAWGWWEAAPVRLGPESGGVTVATVQAPHSPESYWLVDQPRGVVETVPLQLENATSRPVTLDGIDPLFSPDAVVRLRAVDEHLAPEGPTVPAAGYTLRPGTIVQLYLPVDAQGCDSTAPDGTTNGAYATADELTVHFHRLGIARSTTVELRQRVVLAWGGDTANGDRLSCVAPPG